ncbi:MAG TPA: DUF2127 domain-containing protein [Candidatus Acidoferrum sp.]|nr:DUF2127 domain-containing protein [Candidatus Acidoferrum sp.]
MQTNPPPNTPSTRQHPRGLLLIAAFKLIKGLALLAVGIAVHMLANKNLVAEAQHWVDLFRVDPHNRYLHLLLEKLTNVDAHKLHALSLGTFIYSALFLTEATGLFLRKRWAEFLTVLSTAGLIPLEFYELVERPTLMRVLLLLVNLAVVAYLIFEIRRLSRANRTASS